jgi:hypothetical protein
VSLTATQARPQGPCDIYDAAGTPCVAAHSTTRALYAGYTGPLYQVTRRSDGRTLDIGVVGTGEASRADTGGYADGAAQDAFCADTICVISRLYDQSGHGNDLHQAPAGPLFPGPAKGAFDTQPLADMAPVTLAGHKVYGVYIIPGMGFRNNDATGLAVGDEPEGIYYVVDGTHYDSGCCFDYGNASTNGRAVGTGTMETTYFGTATAWGRGAGPGPWIMADMEAGLFSGYDAKENRADPTIEAWRFVTAVVDGGGGNRWDLRGGNAQQGRLTTFYAGSRPGSLTNDRYYPMHKQGAILLGTGGDNGNGSAGTFYEGVMTTGFPSEATTDAVQANIVAARYDVSRLTLSRVTTFAGRAGQDVTATFVNTSQSAAEAVKVTLSAPPGWDAVVAGTTRPSATFAQRIPPGASVSATFRVTPAAATGAGILTASAEWTDAATAGTRSESTTARVRHVMPIVINEVRLGTGTDPTDQFVELYNASGAAVDLSGWSLVHTASQWAPVTLARIPAGTRMGRGAFYLLGLASSGLAAPAAAGATRIHVRSTAGFANGQTIDIEGERRTIVGVGTAASAMTTVFVPVSTGPWIAVPAGSSSLPVVSTAGFAVGQLLSINPGEDDEMATVQAVGAAATQTTLASDAAAGATGLVVVAGGNLTTGDALTVGTGGRKEVVRIASLSAIDGGRARVELAAPLAFDHAAGVDVSDPGTGIRFSPATRAPHRSGDAVQALGTGLLLDRPLTRAHAYGAPVVRAGDTTRAYHGPLAPQQWFGSTLSTRAGSLALLDARGTLVDAIVYGSQQSSSSANGTITSPEIAVLEGDQGKGGCIAVVPAAGRGRGPAPAEPANRSLGRFPDGADTDSLCEDFHLQPATVLAAAVTAGATNIKVGSVAGFAVGQSLTLDPDARREAAVIAAVGTAGATVLRVAAGAGTAEAAVASAAGFSAGQSVTIDSGPLEETATVASVTGGRGGSTLTLVAPFTKAHAAGAQIAGSGLTLAAPLRQAHAAGASVISAAPTPGGPNQYAETRR